MNGTSISSPTRESGSALRENTYFLFSIVGVLWVVEVVDAVLPLNLDQFGIRPRSVGGLVGILFAPFLHGSWGHLIGNTVPFLVLGGLVMLSGLETFLAVSIISAIVAGFGTLLFAPEYTLGGMLAVHIGISGVIFGYLGFLLLRAWFTRSLLWTFVAVVAGLLYGGLILTLLKAQEGISWHGHFFGFGGGVFAAWLLTRKEKAATP